MKRAAILWACLVLGVGMAIASLLIPCARSETVGIIGGADAPSFWFYFMSRLDGWLPCLLSGGAALAVSAVSCLALRNAVAEHSSLPTTAVALGLSAVGAAGLVCALTWFFIVAFNDISSRPIRYPLSICLGLVCLMLFIGLLALYARLRKSRLSAIGVGLDIATAVLYLPAFFFFLTAVLD